MTRQSATVGIYSDVTFFILKSYNILVTSLSNEFVFVQFDAIILFIVLIVSSKFTLYLIDNFHYY